MNSFKVGDRVRLSGPCLRYWISNLPSRGTVVRVISGTHVDIRWEGTTCEQCAHISNLEEDKLQYELFQSR
jgi:hypothetical protein